MSQSSFEHLLRPIRIGSLNVRNRVMLTTHNPKLTDARYLAYLEERVANGVGMVGIPVVEYAANNLSLVTSGRIDKSFSSDIDCTPDPSSEEGADFFDRSLLPRLKSRADIAHKHGAVCFGQVGGRGAVFGNESFQARIAPSPVVDDHVRAVPHELSLDEIRRLLFMVRRLAVRIKNAGLDGVELHGTHGYLFEQFLSPYTNRRTDIYGGSFENRFRLLAEAIEQIRDICGQEFPIGIRLSARQNVAGGLTLSNMQKIVERLSNSIVYINVTAGTFTGMQGGPGLPYVAPSYLPQGLHVEAAAALKSVSNVPVIVTGRNVDPLKMEEILASGKADMIGVTRALMADPELLTKVARGQHEHVRKCIGTNECHFPDRATACAINASMGREAELRITPANRRKRVLVVGGGPAGMEAARVAALRGHDVSLMEKSEALGGQIATLCSDPNRKEMKGYIEFLIKRVRDSGINIVMNKAADAESVRTTAPDVLILATGSVQEVSNGPASGAPRAVAALDVYRGTAEVGDRVLVVGGLDDHLPPPTTAEFLADKGKKVTLISQCMFMGQALEFSVLNLLTKRVLDKGIEVIPQAEFMALGDPITVRNVFTRREWTIPDIDTVVFATGRRANDELASSVQGLAPEIYQIGDCLAPRRLVYATMDGARIATRV